MPQGPQNIKKKKKKRLSQHKQWLSIPHVNKNPQYLADRRGDYVFPTQVNKRFDGVSISQSQLYVWFLHVNLIDNLFCELLCCHLWNGNLGAGCVKAPYMASDVYKANSPETSDKSLTSSALALWEILAWRYWILGGYCKVITKVTRLLQSHQIYRESLQGHCKVLRRRASRIFWEARWGTVIWWFLEVYGTEVGIQWN